MNYFDLGCVEKSHRDTTEHNAWKHEQKIYKCEQKSWNVDTNMNISYMCVILYDVEDVSVQVRTLP